MTHEYTESIYEGNEILAKLSRFSKFKIVCQFKSLHLEKTHITPILDLLLNVVLFYIFEAKKR